jgi:hypothetical protein
MTKQQRTDGDTEPRKSRAVRLTPEQEARVLAYVFVTGRTFQDLAETGLFEYLGRLKLTPEQQKKLKVMIG